MHVGGPCSPIVKVGDRVLRGQLIAEPSGLGANIHASYTGEVTAVTETDIVIKADDKQNFDEYVKIPDTKPLLLPALSGQAGQVSRRL